MLPQNNVSDIFDSLLEAVPFLMSGWWELNGVKLREAGRGEGVGKIKYF